MAETDSKRSKINELLDYIESRLTELEEEKEELKEFQDKDKERRCLEYALYQRELEEVGEALVEIEEDRKAEVHGSNMRREKFNAREQEVQVSIPPRLPFAWLTACYSGSRKSHQRGKARPSNPLRKPGRDSGRAHRLYQNTYRARMHHRRSTNGWHHRWWET